MKVYETVAFKPELKVKTPSAGFKLARSLATAPSSDSAIRSAPARPPRKLSAPTLPRWRVRADLPARSPAPRGAGTREQIAAGARGSFAFLWRAHNSGGLACGGLQEGQSRLSLHSDTVHLPQGGVGRAPPRVGVAGLPGAWGSGHLRLLRPSVRIPCTGALHDRSVCMQSPLPRSRVLAPAAAQSTQPGALRGDRGSLVPRSLKYAPRNPFPEAPSTGYPERLGPPLSPIALASRVLASGSAITERSWRIR